MIFEAKLDQQGRLCVPADVQERLGLEAGSEILVRVLKPRIPGAPHDPDRMSEALDFYSGSQRDQFLAEGWTSVDEYMSDLRGR